MMGRVQNKNNAWHTLVGWKSCEWQHQDLSRETLNSASYLKTRNVQLRPTTVNAASLISLVEENKMFLGMGGRENKVCQNFA